MQNDHVLLVTSVLIRVLLHTHNRTNTYTERTVTTSHAFHHHFPSPLCICSPLAAIYVLISLFGSPLADPLMTINILSTQSKC